jgi:hypothetical protein
MLTSLDGLRGAAAQLHTLNLSGNSLAGLDGLAGCTQLQTLLAADNELESAHALADLEGLPCLETVDLQGSQLADPGATLRLLATLPRLKCLYLKGTPLVRAAQNYRKRVIAALPGLTYLDDRPVFEQERRCAEAWCGRRAAGGALRCAALMLEVQADRLALPVQGARRDRGGARGARPLRAGAPSPRAPRVREPAGGAGRGVRQGEIHSARRDATAARCISCHIACSDDNVGSPGGAQRRAALGLPAGDADPFSALEERRLEPSGERSEASVAEAWRGEAGGSGGETVCEEVDGGGAA